MTITTGTTISFQSASPIDDNIYKGKVIGKGDYDLMNALDPDLAYYNTNVKLSLTNLASADTHEYFVLLTDTQERIVFTEEWISTGTLKVISSTGVGNFDVYGVSELNKQDIIDILREAGFNSKCIVLK